MAALFTADIENRGLVLDPRTKLLVMITLVIFALGGAGSDIAAVRFGTAAVSILPVILLVTARQYKKAAASGILYVLIKAAEICLDIGSLALPKGAVIAVVGHNGAGKTTFTKCLCGLQKHFKGIVRTEGKTYRPKDMMRMAYMVMQDVNHQLFAETVLEEVMLGADDAAEQNVLDILEKLHIANYKDRHPMSLSGGQKQRVAIASALLAGKKLLVFDEPTSGLDFRSMECTAELLRSLDPDITVLIVTHDMELIDRCCTHILHIESGQPESGYNRKRKRNETDKNDVG